jgi:uncharacterized membrane protein YgcG
MNPGKVFRYASCWLIALLIAAPLGVFAAAPGDGKSYKQEQLDQLVAPIALYPDSLLAQVLMASTYPLEVVQADRWVKQNSKLKGDSLNAALDKMGWDSSVKALVPFPQVLSMMSEQLDWTQKLGDAFLAQQEDITNTVQKMRAKARAQDNLKTTKEQKVIVEQQIIRIEPADPQVIYIPSYNPVVVYGPWPYPAYPPYYWGSPAVAAGVGFVAGVAVGAAWANGWGHWNWNNGTLNVNVNKNININNLKNANIQTANWQHDPQHRKGVGYHDDASRQRYAQKTPGSPDSRRDFRGRTPETGPQGLHQTGFKDPGRTPGPPDRARGGGATPAGRPGEFGSRGFDQTRPAAFEGMGHGRDAMQQSDRGRMSRESAMQGGGFGGGGHGGFSGGGRGGGFHGGGRGRR